MVISKGVSILCKVKWHIKMFDKGYNLTNTVIRVHTIHNPSNFTLTSKCYGIDATSKTLAGRTNMWISQQLLLCRFRPNVKNHTIKFHNIPPIGYRVAITPVTDQIM